VTTKGTRRAPKVTRAAWSKKGFTKRSADFTQKKGRMAVTGNKTGGLKRPIQAEDPPVTEKLRRERVNVITKKERRGG